MSAFFVGKADIDVLVSAMRQHNTYIKLGPFGSSPASRVDANALGRMLWRENLNSLRFCYPDDDWTAEETEIDAYVFAQYVDLKPGGIAKLAHCYDYQSCEHDGWETSNAKFCIDSLLGALVESLPGYQNAPWGLEADPKRIALVGRQQEESR